jgi:Holliday junction resolvase RusA-like endonuclease
MLQGPEPTSGELIIKLEMPPVSQRAAKQRKATLTAAIQREIAEAGYFLTGEISIDIEWMVHDRLRYETNWSPDVDNILKPTIDAVAGPNGIMIDDCQIQAISCRWIDWTVDRQRIMIQLRHDPDEWIEKASIAFVRVAHCLYMPIDESLPTEALEVQLSALESMFASRDKLVTEGIDHYTAMRLLPIQRAFHIGRLAGKFRVFDASEFRTRHGMCQRASGDSNGCSGQNDCRKPTAG